MATAVRQAGQRLSKAAPAGDDWKGKAASSFVSAVSDDGRDLEKAAGSFNSVAGALSKLATVLDDAQDEVQRWARKVKDAEERAKEAEQRATDAADKLEAARARTNPLLPLPAAFDPLAPFTAPAESAAYQSAQGEATEAKGNLTTIRTKAEDAADKAVKKVERADQDAAGQIKDAAGKAPGGGAKGGELASGLLKGAPSLGGLLAELGSTGAQIGALFASTTRSSSPFDEEGRITRLDLTVEDFDRMSAEERLQWIRQVQRQYSDDYDVSGWFNNIEGVIQFEQDKAALKPGSWFSLVNASILMGIQDGLARAKGKSPRANSEAAKGWQAFFESRERRAGPRSRAIASEADSERLWGDAEQAATDYGSDVVAPAHGQYPTPQEGTYLALGDLYRKLVKSEAPVVDTLVDPRNREFSKDASEAVYDYFGEGSELVEETSGEGRETVREVSEAPWYRKPDQAIEGGLETAGEAAEGSAEILGQAADGVWETGDDVLGAAWDRAKKIP